ncbi:MAG: ATP-binding protein, partial [Bacteroidales bacterium]
WLEWCDSLVFNDQKEPIEIIGLGRDITDKKNMEFELIKAKMTAEDSDKFKTAFLQNISHEIRTPLNAICGFSNVLLQPNLKDEDKERYLGIILKSSNQLLKVVTDIIIASSLVTNQVTVFKTKFNINTLLHELYLMYKEKAKENNTTLYLTSELSDNDAEIYTDSEKVKQILINLLSNAIKFTNKGIIQFGYIINSDGLEFFVKDTGIGIKEEMLEKIFNLFSQADSNIQNNFGGTGLGLAISKGFVELLGGKIRVESEEKKGTSFYFTIPHSPVA